MFGKNFPRLIAQRLLGGFPKIDAPRPAPVRPQASAPQRTNLKNEAFYRDQLAHQLRGQIEVSTPDGKCRIDILTATELIEVKRADRWRAALGQVMHYGMYFPKHRKRIHLFGPIDPTDLNAARQVCAQSQVQVSYIEV